MKILKFRLVNKCEFLGSFIWESLYICFSRVVFFRILWEFFEGCFFRVCGFCGDKFLFFEVGWICGKRRKIFRSRFVGLGRVLVWLIYFLVKR